MVRSCYKPCKPKCKDIPRVPSEVIINNEDIQEYANTITEVIKALQDSLDAIAFSGDYNDLKNKPTIGDGTLTVYYGNNAVGTFTANLVNGTNIALPIDNELNAISTNPVQNKIIFNKLKYTILELKNFTKALINPIYQTIEDLNTLVLEVKNNFDNVTKYLGTYIHYRDNTCKWDSSITLDPELYSEDANIDFIILSPKITSLQAYTFWRCINLKTVIFPSSSSITRIGAHCFSECSSIKNITIAETVNYIDEYAFSNSGIEYAFIKNNHLNLLGKGSFEGCQNLQEILLSFDNGSLPADVFKNCISLKKVVLSGIIGLHISTFSGATNLLHITIINSSVETLYRLFAGCENLQTVNIQGVVRIAERSFQGCISLKLVLLSENLVDIGAFAFNGCTSLEELIIPNTKNNDNKRILNRALHSSSIKKLVLYNPDELFESWSLDTNLKNTIVIYSYLDSNVLNLCDSFNINFEALNTETLTDLLLDLALPVTSRAVKRVTDNISNTLSEYQSLTLIAISKLQGDVDKHNLEIEAILQDIEEKYEETSNNMETITRAIMDLRIALTL